MSSAAPLAGSFDYVIVGGGTAACVLANRLSEDGRYTVCMLEAGPPDWHPWLHLPGGFIKAVADPRFTWPFKSEPGAGTAGRPISIPQGRTLGGSSSVNGFVYNRGRAADFDHWADLGNPGWSYADLLPYFKRSEQRIGPHDPKYRGESGPMRVTDCDWPHPLCEAFLNAAGSIGIPRNPDYNGAAQVGAGYFQRIIHGRWRVSAAKAYLRPARQRRNLEVRTGSQVVAIEFEGRRAKGVRVMRGGGVFERVQAAREVLVCAGAANTPKLLQLSGLGPGQHLASLGVHTLVDLPGVGENLRDHYVVRSVARVSGATTINDYARGLQLVGQVARWALGMPSILTLSPSIAYAYWQSSAKVDSPDVMMVFTPGSYVASVSGLLDRFPGVTLGFGQMRPRSTGYVRAASADPQVDPVIQPNYLSAESDQRVVIDALRLTRQVLQAPALARHVQVQMSPPPECVSDDELLDFARRSGNTSYHLCGTSRMGLAQDRLAVVDSQLRVHGAEGLRVVDASIMPDITSANTMAAVLAIAEKASDMILGTKS